MDELRFFSGNFKVHHNLVLTLDKTTRMKHLRQGYQEEVDLLKH